MPALFPSSIQRLAPRWLHGRLSGLRARLLAAVLAPMLAIGGTAIIASQALEGRFHHLERQALEAELASGIATDFAELRRLAREHAFTGDWAYFSATKSYTKSLQVQIDEGLVLVQDPARRAELRQIGARISAYLGHVKALGKLKEDQQALVEGVLDPTGTKLGDLLQGLAAAVEGDDAAMHRATTALRQLLELRSLVGQAIGRSDAAAEEATEQAFASFTGTLAALGQAGVATPLQPGLAEVGRLASRYHEAFRQAAAPATSYKWPVLARDGAELLVLVHVQGNPGATLYRVDFDKLRAFEVSLGSVVDVASARVLQCARR